jgi:hypothetical protein
LHISTRVLLLALLALAGCGSSDSKSSSSSNAKTAKVKPVLKVVGNGGKCDLSSGKTFHFEGSGFTPDGKVMVLIFAPRSYKDPLYPNPYDFYWYHKNFGVFLANAKGEIRSNDWGCRNGPGGKKDPIGQYQFRGLDWKSGKATSREHFNDVP